MVTRTTQIWGTGCEGRRKPLRRTLIFLPAPFHSAIFSLLSFLHGLCFASHHIVSERSPVLLPFGVIAGGVHLNSVNADNAPRNLLENI